jgi:hypothetical protein
MNEWIKSKDKLPEPHKIVGFYYDDNYHIGTYCNQSEYTKAHLWQSYIDYYNCIEDVEFWFELPNIEFIN